MKLTEFIEKYGDRNVDENELKKVLGIKDKKYFIPNVGERYFVVSRSGKVDRYANDSTYDTEVFESSEVFQTKEEAEEHAKRQRFLLKMKRDFLDNSGDIVWGDKEQINWSVGYDHVKDELDIDGIWTTQFNDFYTTNKEWLEEYIKEYEEEIKKYYFGIKEEVED